MKDDAHWDSYNAIQGGRAVRELCQAAMREASGRMAIDLGCGAGVETRALLNAGWQVHAVDGAPGTPALVTRTVGGVHARLTLDERHYADLESLPPAI